MDTTRFAERLMAMDENTWQRHANPWSVYTRFSIMPMLSLAIWSRAWLGWYAVIPVTLSILWIWLNPRVFGAPRSTNSWASKGTFGERIYLRKSTLKIPKHHLHIACILQLLSAVGLPILVYGLYVFDLSAVLLGNVMIMVFKAWFVDRMVWLYEDMRYQNAEFQGWLKE